MTAALLAFALTATLLILAPGPDSMLVMRNTLRRGRSAGWITACGTLSGLLVWAVAAAQGVAHDQKAVRAGRQDHQGCGQGERQQRRGHRAVLPSAPRPRRDIHLAR